MSDGMRAFFGFWVLESDIEDARSAIWPVAGAVSFADAWTGADGQRQQAVVSVPPDGRVHVVGDAQVMVTLVSDRVLEAEVRVGTAVQWTRRELEAGGQGMRVVQRLDGSEVVAHYRRGGVKQVICYRRELKMRKGKIAAQCAHASLAVFLRRGAASGLTLQVPQTLEMALWSQWRSAKIVLSVESEADLLRVHAEAHKLGLPAALIRDAGLTEFGGVPTYTAVAVGPALSAQIDVITGRDGLVETKLA